MMKRKKLTKREFARAITNGLGSAFLHIKEFGDKGVEDELLNACLTNLVFDTQQNTGRSDWLARMLDRTNRIDEYVIEIKSALMSDSSVDDLNQLIYLAAELFERGFGEFQPLILQLAHKERREDVSWNLSHALVDIAGQSGFESAVKMIMTSSADDRTICALYDYTCTQLDDSGKVYEFVQNMAKNDTSFARFWDTVQREKEERLRQPEPWVPKTWTKEEVLSSIQSDPNPRRHRSKCARFGKTMSEADALSVIKLIENETDSGTLCRYTNMFRDKPFPIIPKNASDLVFSEDRLLRKSACSALSNVKSSVVRQLAFRALKAGTEEFIAAGLDLLTENYQSGDAEMILLMLKKLREPDWIHWGAMPAKDIAERNWDKSLVPVLLWIYNSTPCGFCRENALQQLIDRNEVPPKILFEAQWDSEPAIRSMARASITGPN